MNDANGSTVWYQGVEPPGWASLPTLAVVATFTLLAGWIAVGLTGFELALLAIPLAALVGFLTLHNERIWIYGALLGQAFNTIGGGRGIAIGDVMYGVWVLGGLMLWFGKELVVHRRPIARSGFDVLFLMFFTLSTLVAAVAHAMHDGILQKFFTEWSVVCNLLLYFPMRKAFNNRSDITKALVVFAVVATINGVVNVLNYRERLVDAVLETDIEGARSATNETMSVAMLILCTSVYAYARRLRMVVLGLAGMGISLVFLLISFSRGPILAGILVVLLMAPLSARGIRKKLVAAYGVTAVLGAAVMLLIFPTIARNVGESLVGRISTISSARTDWSVKSRLFEVNALVRDIEASPFIGHGYGVEYVYFDKVRRRTIRTSFIHVGWLWPFYKFGVPVGVLFLGFLFYPMIRLLINTPRPEQRHLHAIAVGSGCFLIAYCMITSTSNQFSDFAGSACAFLSWAMLDFVNRSVESSRRLQGQVRLLPAASTTGG